MRILHRHVGDIHQPHRPSANGFPLRSGICGGKSARCAPPPSSHAASRRSSHQILGTEHRPAAPRRNPRDLMRQNETTSGTPPYSRLHAVLGVEPVQRPRTGPETRAEIKRRPQEIETEPEPACAPRYGPGASGAAVCRRRRGQRARRRLERLGGADARDPVLGVELVGAQDRFRCAGINSKSSSGKITTSASTWARPRLRWRGSPGSVCSTTRLPSSPTRRPPGRRSRPRSRRRPRGRPSCR